MDRDDWGCLITVFWGLIVLAFWTTVIFVGIHYAVKYW